MLAAAGCFLSGSVVGATSIGGFLIVPTLMMALGVNVGVAVGATLASFIPSAVIAVYLYRRSGNLRAGLGVALGLVSVPGIYLGLWLSRQISERAAEVVLGSCLVVLALYIAVQWAVEQKERRRAVRGVAAKSGVESTPATVGALAGNPVTLLVFLLASLAAGAGASLAGVGGALILVPLMISFNVAPPIAVGTGLLASGVTAVFATAGRLMQEPLHLGIILLVTASYSLGIVNGEKLSRRVDGHYLKAGIAALCFLSAIAVLV